jgi:alkylated DNA repair dioxygenase AlkB
MNFKATDGSKSRFSILLEPGSLAILEGELRYKWKHSIDRRHIDNIAGVSLKREERISLTFREALPAACSNLQTLC